MGILKWSARVTYVFLKNLSLYLDEMCEAVHKITGLEVQSLRCAGLSIDMDSPVRKYNE